MKAKTKNETVEEVKAPETVEPETIQPEAASETEAPATVEEPQATEQAEPAIPAKALAILKKFAYLESAYINEKGGVFDIDTPANVRGTAVLYKNPYFNL